MDDKPQKNEMQNVDVKPTGSQDWATTVALAKNANAVPQDDPNPVECERCGLTPDLHTPSHWCDNQSFRVGRATRPKASSP